MQISVGLDAAKDFHWAVALDENGSVLLDKKLINGVVEIDAFIAHLHTMPGEVVIGIDVVGSFAAYLEAVLVDAGFELVHVPGLAVNRARDGVPGGEIKSDPRDARIIADMVRTRSDLRPIKLEHEATVEIRLLIGRRRDLVEDQTRRFSRLHQLLGSIHPDLERAVDLKAKAVLKLLSGFVTPTEVLNAGPDALATHLKGARNASALIKTAIETAQAQRLAVPGERMIATLVRELAAEALATMDRLANIERELQELVARHPDGALILSLPGMGAVLGAEFIAYAGDIGRFHSSDALAATAGLAPVLRQSGRSRTTRRAFRGDKDLKNTLYRSAFCAITHHPQSRAFYDRKRREGKRHVQAIIALARRRVDVLWAILRTRRPFNPEFARAA
jgi:transposase